MDNYQAIVERLSVVKGFLTPVMSDDPIPGQRRRFGLDRESFEMVCYGVACPECLAHYEPYVLTKCPVCGHERQPSDLITDASDWTGYLAERKRQIENPQRTQMPPGMDEMVTELGDQILDGWKPGVKKNL